MYIRVEQMVLYVFLQNIQDSAPLNLLCEQVLFHRKKQAEPCSLVFFKNTIPIFISYLFTRSI